ncbi:hypothetical protein D1646_18000, partial [Pseudoflavonifractor sp. 60]|nr:hypothetical protein [Pseudoflavonifractor sp. 60]
IPTGFAGAPFQRGQAACGRDEGWALLRRGDRTGGVLFRAVACYRPGDGEIVQNARMENCSGVTRLKLSFCMLKQSFGEARPAPAGKERRSLA